MKTAISLPDRVFRPIEALAKKLAHSRSEIFVRATGEFLRTHPAQEITASYDRREHFDRSKFGAVARGPFASQIIVANATNFHQ